MADLSERDRAIVEKLAAGATKKAVAEEYGLTRNRIAEIEMLAFFLKSEPDLARACSKRELPSVVFLWSRGYTINPPKRP